jgi:iron complex outermembrane receptor protein
VPKWSGSAQLDYTHAVGTGLDLVWTAQYRYVGSSIAGNGAPPFDPFLDIDSYDIWDASVRLESDRWELALFVDNLFDEYNINRKWAAPFQTVVYETPLPPRHIGVRATLKW